LWLNSSVSVKVTGPPLHLLRRIEYPVTGIPGFQCKGSKNAKMREEIYKIFMFLRVLAVTVFPPELQVSTATGWAGLNNL